MLHPTIPNAETPWSRKKTKRNLEINDLNFPAAPISKPGAIPENSDLKIITLNLARFPFAPGCHLMLYNFIRENPVQIFQFQEVKDTKLLQIVFNEINTHLYSQEYVLCFSYHIHDRTKLCFAYRKNSINYLSHKSIFENVFFKIPHILRPPDVLFFQYQEHFFSLINLHSTPYRAHSSHLKRDKFFHLLRLYQQTFNDSRFFIFGGDWNFRPPGLSKYFKEKQYCLPQHNFKNQIDYFVTYVPITHSLPIYEFFQHSFSHDIIKSDIFKDWKKILSDHFPVKYTFQFI